MSSNIRNIIVIATIIIMAAVSVTYILVNGLKQDRKNRPTGEIQSITGLVTGVKIHRNTSGNDDDLTEVYLNTGERLYFYGSVPTTIQIGKENTFKFRNFSDLHYGYRRYLVGVTFFYPKGEAQ